MCSDFWGYFENITFQEKTADLFFWVTFVTLWATCYFIIWSHRNNNKRNLIPYILSSQPS